MARKERARNEPEHPNLLDNIIPPARGPQLVGEDIVQLLAYGGHPMCHSLDVPPPEVGVVQDQRHLSTGLVPSELHKS